MDGDFSHCGPCQYLHTAVGPVVEVPDDFTAPYGETVEAIGLLNLAIDRTCNLACPTCRRQPWVATPEQRRGITAIQDVLTSPEVLRITRRLSVSGSGDPFVSGPHRELLRRLEPDQYPDLRVKLHTNGLLFNRMSWAMMGPIRSRVDSVEVSVDAATPETYAVNRGGDWGTLNRNLRFVSQLRAAGPVEEFQLSFVVQDNNWREMAAFVDLGRSLGADTVYFSDLMNWGTFDPIQFMLRTVSRPDYAHRAEFLEMLESVRGRPGVFISGLMDPC